MSMTQRNYGSMSRTECSFWLISLEDLAYSKQFRWKQNKTKQNLTLHCLHYKTCLEHLWNGLIKRQTRVAFCLTWVLSEYIPVLYFQFVLPVKMSRRCVALWVLMCSPVNLIHTKLWKVDLRYTTSLFLSVF